MTDNKDNNQRPLPPNPQNRPPGSPGRPPQKTPRSMFSWVGIIMLVLLLMMLLKNFGEPAPEISFTEFETHVKNGDVDKVVISDNALVLTLKEEVAAERGADEPTQFTVVIISSIINKEELSKLLADHNVNVAYERPSGFYEVLIHLIPWILIITVMYFLVFRQFRGMGGGGMLGSFGRSRHRLTSKEQSRATFADVAGIDEAKEEVQEIIEFLRNPRKFQRLGGRIPRGLLLVGAPGCGKTLLARAIAGEADVPFLSISGSDFVEMFVGVGASRVRDLFKQAKENSPCIIFLDEIDAVGRKRGAGMVGGGHDEREQTLNAILVEMDGFSTDDQVIVMAATNRADVLDHALTRPGRFDRQIYVPLPDIKGRVEILKVHAKKVKMSPEADLQRLARGTPMFSGADLEAIINEAALAATMQNKDYVEMEDLEEARDKVRWGRARRSREVDEKEKSITAYHEAGHALAQSLLKEADPLHKVSIIPRSMMGGATFSLPEKDRTLYTRRFCQSMLRVCFAGRVAEEIACDDISSGASGDIQQATEIARRMVMSWGMSDKVGFIDHSGGENANWLAELPGGREYSEHTAQIIDTEIKVLMDAAYKDVRELLNTHRTQLDALQQALLKYETLDGDEVERLMKGEVLDKPTVGDLLEAEQRRSAEEDTPADAETDTNNTAAATGNDDQ